MPLQQIAIAAGGAVVDQTLFNRTTNIAVPALWTLMSSLACAALLDWSVGEYDGIITAAAMTLTNVLTAVVVSVIDSPEGAAEYFLITLSLGVIVIVGRLALPSRNTEKLSE